MVQTILYQEALTWYKSKNIIHISKPVAIRYHIIKELIDRIIFSAHNIPSEKNLADSLAKLLSRTKLEIIKKQFASYLKPTMNTRNIYDAWLPYLYNYHDAAQETQHE